MLRIVLLVYLMTVSKWCHRPNRDTTGKTLEKYSRILSFNNINSPFSHKVFHLLFCAMIIN